MSRYCRSPRGSSTPPIRVKVCLFGPDGSGKTTAAKILAAYLRRRGVKVRISWMRGTHAVASLLARAMRRLGLKGTSNPNNGIDIPPTLYQPWWALKFLSAFPIQRTGDTRPVGLLLIAKNRLKVQTSPPHRAVSVRIREICL